MGAGSNGKVKVAVLGGGVGAMSAAFSLTERPEDQQRYEVTVYQMGWRLGGKGASGRNMAPEKGARIQEHGLHVWMGCYHNAFATMQKAYSECARLGLTPGTPFPGWRDAFKEQSLVRIFEPIDGQWLPWTVVFPTNDLDPGHGGEWLTPWEYVAMLLHWLFDRIQHSTLPAVVEARRRSAARDEPDWVRDLHAQAAAIRPTRAGPPSSGDPTHLQMAHELAQSLPADAHDHDANQHHGIVWLVDQFVADFDHCTSGRAHLNDAETDLRRLAIVLDLSAATIRGIIRDGVLFHGMDPLDRWEFREWLALNGARSWAVWSAPVKALYDLVFAYEKGKADQPNLAAGGGLRTILRISFGYRGSFCYKMQAGMGDTVFTPLYEVLKARGVRFCFFHRVESLGLSPDGNLVQSIDVGVQATVKPDAGGGTGQYQPLVMVKGLGCWPSEPDYSQLVEGGQLKAEQIDLESSWTPWQCPHHKTLRLGQDFDLVILGISLAQLKYTCKDLVDRRVEWRNMVDHVQTVQTENCQVWHNQTAQQMGWNEPERVLFGAYPWSGADMSQVEPHEQWDPGLNVKTVAYYCRQFEDAAVIPPPFTDPDFPQRELARVKQDGLEMMNTLMKPLWPQATSPSNPDGINWGTVVDPHAAVGEGRFDFQYIKANIDPTERYVMSVKASTPYRLPGDQSGFPNLYLAGDWTRNGLNMGCVEAAVISGMQASRAICGYPQTIVGEKDMVFSPRGPVTFVEKVLRWIGSLFGLEL